MSRTEQGHPYCKVYLRHCQSCGALFVGRGERARNCSRRCKKRAELAKRPKRPKLVRKRIPARTRECPVCASPFTGGAKTCGALCGIEYRRRSGSYPASTGRVNGKWPSCKVYPIPCGVCGRSFIGRHAKAKYCSGVCGRLVQSRRHQVDPARASMEALRGTGVASGMSSNKVLLPYLMKRDRGRCGICRRQIVARKGPMRPSIDHIIPLTRGGAHELSNVQLAHFRCNMSKGNRGGGEQLLLVG